MPIVQVGKYRQFAPTCEMIYELMVPQKAPLYIRHIREMLWDYQKEHVGELGEILYVHYPTLRKCIDELVASGDVTKVTGKYSWPRYEISR